MKKKSTKTGRPEGGDGPTKSNHPEKPPFMEVSFRICRTSTLIILNFLQPPPLIVQRECWGLGNYVLSVCFVCSAQNKPKTVIQNLNQERLAWHTWMKKQTSKNLKLYKIEKNTFTQTQATTVQSATERCFNPAVTSKCHTCSSLQSWWASPRN